MTSRLILKTDIESSAQQVVFVVHPDISCLPDRPGLFALLGRRGGDDRRPLYFGYADRSMLDQVPYDLGFARAIRDGMVSFASAYVPSGEDPHALVDALAQAYDAPVNAAGAAMAEIDEARQILHAQAMARRLAAQ
ncbi:hypothetical protein [Pseudooceanicola sp. MF1-13]|uniref:hypothetical protein n=1 Tax=Pseudooceanicola sp. MF1-13 TaxID=3379095 RepID=UPI003892B73F